MKVSWTMLQSVKVQLVHIFGQYTITVIWTSTGGPTHVFTSMRAHVQNGSGSRYRSGSDKPAPNASFALLPLLILYLSLHHLHQIQAQTCMDVFEKFPFQVKNEKRKRLYLTSRVAGQSEHSELIGRGALKRQELKQPVSDRGWTEGLHEGSV